MKKPTKNKAVKKSNKPKRDKKFSVQKQTNRQIISLVSNDEKLNLIFEKAEKLREFYKQKEKNGYQV